MWIWLAWQKGDVNKWHFTKYDELNRPVVAGMTKLVTEAQTSLQGRFESTTPAKESLSACTIGYSNTAYPHRWNSI